MNDSLSEALTTGCHSAIRIDFFLRINCSVKSLNISGVILSTALNKFDIEYKASPDEISSSSNLRSKPY
jgi:hypothetical protein